MEVFEIEPPEQTITFEYFDYHGLQMYGMVITTMLETYGGDGSLHPKRNYLVSEKDMATALECSQNRLHKAVVRNRSWFSYKHYTLKSLEDTFFDMEYNRLHWQGVVYNPVNCYRRVFADLAQRRPYINKARELYVKTGYPKSQFGRQGLIK